MSRTYNIDSDEEDDVGTSSTGTRWSLKMGDPDTFFKKLKVLIKPAVEAPRTGARLSHDEAFKILAGRLEGFPAEEIDHQLTLLIAFALEVSNHGTSAVRHWSKGRGMATINNVTVTLKGVVYSLNAWGKEFYRCDNVATAKQLAQAMNACMPAIYLAAAMGGASGLEWGDLQEVMDALAAWCLTEDDQKLQSAYRDYVAVRLAGTKLDKEAFDSIALRFVAGVRAASKHVKGVAKFTKNGKTAGETPAGGLGDTAFTAEEDAGREKDASEAARDVADQVAAAMGEPISFAEVPVGLVVLVARAARETVEVEVKDMANLFDWARANKFTWIKASDTALATDYNGRVVRAQGVKYLAGEGTKTSRTTECTWPYFAVGKRIYAWSLSG